MTPFQREMTCVENAVAGMAGKTVVFWGAGRRMRGFLKTECVENKRVPMPDYICDSTRDIAESRIEGVPVIGFDQVRKMNTADTVIVITAGLLELQAQVVPSELYYFPIYHVRSFEAWAFLRDNLDDFMRVYDMLADDHSRDVYATLFRNLLNGSMWCQSLFEPEPYFANDVIGDLDDADRLVLAGAFNGKHVDRALANNPRVHIDAFEPNAIWFQYLCNKYSDKPNVVVHDKILWDKPDRLGFDGDMLHGGLDAHVSAADTNFDVVVDGISIDTYLPEKPTLIALDVEGSEAKVIQGSAKLIAQSRPKLTLCLYHGLRDFIDLPLMIHGMDGEYKLYAKHHSCLTAIETVLYAV